MLERIKKLVPDRLAPVDVLVAVFAVALQIQLTLFSAQDYAGLRVNLADFFLPFAGLWVAFRLAARKDLWPVWDGKYTMPLALFSMFAVMTIALLHGYEELGGWSLWALLNKYAGFLILLFYFLLGSWIVSNSENADSLRARFSAVFCGFFILVLLASAVLLIIQIAVPFPLWVPAYPWDGFMANRNACMVLMVMVLVFLLWGGEKERSRLRIRDRTENIFWVLLPVFLVCNGSRTGWFAAAFLLLFAILTARPFTRFLRIVLLFAAGCVLALGAISVTAKAARHSAMQFDRTLALLQDNGDVAYTGDQRRVIAIEDGLELYRDSNPILGAGLGAYRKFQEQKRGEFIDVIDFSALWLLVETGAPGLAVFAGFFFFCLYTSYHRGIRGGSAFHKSVFIFLMAFAFMSCLHELLYTRFLWFVLGLAMATDKKEALR